MFQPQHWGQGIIYAVARLSLLYFTLRRDMIDSIIGGLDHVNPNDDHSIRRTDDHESLHHTGKTALKQAWEDSLTHIRTLPAATS